MALFDCDECAAFWRDIIAPRGQLDAAAVAVELHDYRVVLHEVALVYCHVTGGRISKPNTLAAHVIAEVEEYMGGD